MRFWMSSALIPLYVQTTLTTGMLMSGKMSVAICEMASAPSSKTNTTAAMIVYGR